MTLDDCFSILGIQPTESKSEIKSASELESVFELNWYVFFSRYMSLGVTDFENLGVTEKLRKNVFLKSMVNSKQYVFPNSQVNLFQTPTDCRGTKLRIRLDVFNREEID